MHVSSSTEGYFVMTDDYTFTSADFLAGPFATVSEADDAMHTLAILDSKPTWFIVPASSHLPKPIRYYNNNRYEVRTMSHGTRFVYTDHGTSGWAAGTMLISYGPRDW
jgi:hypothetical protein